MTPADLTAAQGQPEDAPGADEPPQTAEDQSAGDSTATAQLRAEVDALRQQLEARDAALAEKDALIDSLRQQMAAQPPPGVSGVQDSQAERPASDYLPILPALMRMRWSSRQCRAVRHEIETISTQRGASGVRRESCGFRLASAVPEPEAASKAEAEAIYQRLLQVCAHRAQHQRSESVVPSRRAAVLALSKPDVV